MSAHAEEQQTKSLNYEFITSTVDADVMHSYAVDVGCYDSEGKLETSHLQLALSLLSLVELVNFVDFSRRRRV